MTVFVPEDLPTRPESRTPLVQGMLFRIGAVLVLGIAGGLVWLWGTPLTSYVITEEGTATTTERGLALGASPVAAFTIIALVLGIIAALMLWGPSRRQGWVTVPITLGSVLVAEAIMWGIGSFFGPGPLDPRILAGEPGDTLSAELALTTPVPLAAGLFGASVVLMTLASLTPDPETAIEGRATPDESADDRWAPRPDPDADTAP